MKKQANYFCLDDGWEGGEPICPICSQPSEPLDVGESSATVRAELANDNDLAPDLELVDDFAEEELPKEEREEEF
ncbi:MAG: hypothetical protein WAP74_00640 [Patescibacteria group bacterium]